MHRGAKLENERGKPAEGGYHSNPPGRKREIGKLGRHRRKNLTQIKQRPELSSTMRGEAQKMGVYQHTASQLSQTLLRGVELREECSSGERSKASPRGFPKKEARYKGKTAD